MTFKNYHQKQSFLLPPNFAEFLGESHEAVMLSEFLNELDTSALEQSYNNQNGGCSAYHPVMLLSILAYGYMNGIFSSRQLAKQLRQNLAFMYLAGSTAPDFRTLARFRKEKGAHLESILAAVVRKAEALGLVKFGTCCLDGTKIYASAGSGRNRTQKKLEEKIRALIEEAEKVDQMEDAEFGDEEDGENAELKTKAGRDKKRKELADLKKKQEDELDRLNALAPANEDARVNLTDPDSKLMQMKRKDFANGYNVQSITENGVILSNSISNSSADGNTLIPSLQKMQSIFSLPKKLLADKGYSSEDNYDFCELNAIDAYIPVYSQQVDISGYAYDQAKDEYSDAAGRVYRFKQHEERRDGLGRRGRPNKTAEPLEQQRRLYRSAKYECWDEETQKKKYLTVSLGWQSHVKKQKEKLATPRGKSIYKQRMHDVEGVFANIKKNLRFTSFNLRGFAGVSAEWTLISLAHNLKKIM